MQDIELDQEVNVPEGFQIRHPSEADLEGIANIIIATDIVERGESDFSPEDLQVDWRRQDFDLNEDAWVVVTLSKPGLIVGYEEVWNRAYHAVLMGDGYVHPDFKNLGIGTSLLRAMEARARQHIALAPSDLRVTLRNGLYGKDFDGARLLSAEGYRSVRYFWRMRADLEAPPPQPAWPEQIRLTHYQAENEEMVHQAVEDAFRDHWSHVPVSFENWRLRIETDYHDPGLWFLAWDGDQLAGVTICRFKGSAGWISTLGVRQPWRKQGLGLALLQQAFGEFYRRGARIIELAVDAQNLTGATRIYERAEMRVEHEFVIFEKELRLGAEPGEEEATG